MTRTYDITLADLQEQHAVVVRGHVSTEEIAEFLGGAFGETAGAATAQGLAFTGAPFARYRFTDDGRFAIEAGFPVSRPVTPSGRVEATTLPGGTTARTMHVGSYDAVAAAYEAMHTYLTENGYEVTAAPWECYLDDPEVANPRTEVFMPCRPVRPRED